MDQNFIIQQSLVQAIGDYLIQRPYREVAPIVAALSQLQPVAPAAPLTQPSVEEPAVV